MRSPPNLPDLREDATVGFVDCIDYLSPTGNLVPGPNTRCERPAKAMLRNADCLIDYQIRACALYVVLNHDVCRQVRLPATRTRHSRHENAVRCFDGPEPNGSENCRHVVLQQIHLMNVAANTTGSP